MMFNLNNNITTHFVGIGQYKFSTGPNQQVKIVGLGSCVGVVIFIPKITYIGMAHVALPEYIDNDKTRNYHPCFFADTAISFLIDEIKLLNVFRFDIIIKLVGGSVMLDPNSNFDIGKRNALSIKKHLWMNGLGATSEDLGGDMSRTVSGIPTSTKLTVTSPGKENWEF